jgi:hypothetical protein
MAVVSDVVAPHEMNHAAHALSCFLLQIYFQIWQRHANPTSFLAHTPRVTVRDPVHAVSLAAWEDMDWSENTEST